ncbi:MAG TPA: MotA/TolQ/ExbB proton channel family protein [Cellvibrionaceae bacterium]
MDLIKFFQSGGFFMYPILLVMTLGIAIAIERFIYLAITQRATETLWKRLLPMLKARDVERAHQVVESQKTPLARVFNYGFARLLHNAKRETVEAAMEEGVMEVTPLMQERTHYLATLANIATLLGLLGTIIGLIDAFTAVSTADPAQKAELLSASIAVAMNTTAFGLVAAIPLLLMHSFLATKTAKLIDNVEMATVKCLNLTME